ncbi:sulfite exporter TauE/SafE family protein [Qipengyuania sp. JC766]|uniref:sulfite exporter TauE/SafE family protein n=1 Tax=Qipengyuania sp. JC766 TaxID=3232139 RepID=UPI003457763F
MDVLAGFTAWQLAAALGTGLVASFIRGLAGFGLAIILVPVLALALTPVEAVLTTNVVAMLIGGVELPRLLREAERSVWFIIGAVLLTTLPGLVLLAATPPDIARVLIALVALSAFFAVLFPVREATQPGPLTTGLTGAATGILTGFAGMPGPPVVPYYVGRAIPRQVAKSSMLLIFTVAAVIGIASGVAIGEMEWRLALLGAMLLPIVLFGTWLGRRADGYISDRVWRGFVGLVLAAAALAAIAKLFV